MKIQGWFIEGFGTFHQHHVQDLPDGLTVFLGPNEAGKSTTLAFLRGMLFGFPKGREADRRYDPLRGGRHGGRAFLAHGGSEWTLERVISPRPQFQLRDADGREGSEDDLRRLLGHADKNMFRNVFAFSLAELQDFNSLNGDGIRDRIFNAGLQGAGRTAGESITQLRTQADAIYKPRGRQSLIHDLLGRLTDTRRRLDVARREVAGYAAACEAEKALAAQLLELQAERSQAQARLEDTKTLLKAWPLFYDRLTAQQALADFGPVRTAPSRAEERLSELTTQVKATQQRLAELQAAQAEARRRLAALKPDEPALALAARVAPLYDSRSAYRAWLSELAEADHQRRMADERVAEVLRELGPDWDAARLDAFDTSLLQEEEIRRWAQRLAQADQAIAEARSRLEQRQQAAETAAEDVDALERQAVTGASQDAELLTRQEQAVLQLRAALSALVERRAALGMDDARIFAFEETLRAQSVRPEASTPAWLRPACWGLSAMLLLAGAWRAIESDMVSAGVLVATALLVGTVGWFVGRRAEAPPMDTSGLKEKLQKARAAQESNRQALQRIEADIARLAGLLELAVPPSSAEVDHCLRQIDDQRRKLDVAEQVADRLKSAIARRDAATTRHAEAAAALAQAETAQQAEQRTWAQWKHERAIPAALSADGVITFLTKVRAGRDTLRALREKEALVERHHAAIAAFEAQARPLFAEPGPTGEALVGAIEALQRRISEALETEKGRAALTEQLAQLQPAADAAQAETAKQTGLLQALFAEAGAQDEAGFRQQIQIAGEQVKLQQVVAQCEQNIALQLGHGARAQALLTRLGEGDVNAWRQELGELEARADAGQTAYDQAIRNHRDAETHRESLEQSADIVALDNEQQMLLSELSRLARQWRVLALAEAMVAETRQRFERERQPAVLGHAARMFERVTAGQYGGLLQQDNGIAVLDAQGGRRDPGALSTGTAEQLYLCLRLGLAREFARQTCDLPLIMDDVMVNFDPERARAMAGAIVDFAREHQVFLFTCHPATAELLQALEPATRVVTMPRYGGAETPTALAASDSGRDMERTIEAAGPAQDPAHRDLVIACLRAADGPLGKREVLQRTELPEAAWNTVINGLMDEGLIERQGQARGTTYQLVAHLAP